MNTRLFSFGFSVSAALLALGTLAAVSAQAPDLPPPPPPIGPFPNAPQPPMPRILPPQTEPPSPSPAPLSFETVSGPALISVDAAAKRHDISPLVYGVSGATPAQLAALNVPAVPAQAGPGLVDFRTVQVPKSFSRVFSADTSPETQAQRNRATHLLWGPHALIPLLKSRLKSFPAGTKTGLLNYSWGAENSIGGATAQADALGIFGREGLDLASRPVPDSRTPTFKAIQMYRNYDGRRSMFGSISVSDDAPSPDTLSSFAAVRRSDGALTVIVINKSPTAPTPITLSVSHFSGANVSAWQLAGANAIVPLPNRVLVGGALTATLPAQSVTLFVVPALLKSQARF